MSAAGGQKRAILQLQKALQYNGEYILINTSQFYSVDKHKVVTKYHIKKQVQSEDNRNKSTRVELFSACSQIQICQFLRDYYYELIGQEVPHDNAYWEQVKAEYFKEH